MWEKVKAKFGHADVLVNNAGTFVGSGPVSKAPADKWWSDFVSINNTLLKTHGD
jgi:NADP-dependent 3-hydroxy acid dehydrogenase YdfG